MKSTSLLTQSKVAAFSQALHGFYHASVESDFPSHVVAIMEGFFGSDIVAYNDFPADNRSVGVKANVDFDPGMKLLPIFLEHFHQNPLSPAVLHHRYLGGARVTDVMPFHRYKKTILYNEYYRKVGADFQMAGVFAGRNKHAIALALNQKSRDFTDQELFLFQLMFPHLREAYELHHVRREASAHLAGLEKALQARDLGVVGFSDGYCVSTVSAKAREWCWRLLHCRPQAGTQLPRELMECVQQLRSKSTDSQCALPRPALAFQMASGLKITLRLCLDLKSRQHCLLWEEHPGAPSLQELAPLGLSTREGEVALWTLQGKTSGEAGIILGISPRTVEKHLESVFAKLGISSRAALEARVRELLFWS